MACLKGECLVRLNEVLAHASECYMALQTPLLHAVMPTSSLTNLRRVAGRQYSSSPLQILSQGRGL